MCRGFAALQMKLEIVSARQFRDETCIGIGVGSANSMMKMCNRDNDAQLIAKVKQNAQQRNRIGSAGNSDRHTLASAQKRLRSNVFGDALG